MHDNNAPLTAAQQAELAALSYEDIYRSMRSIGGPYINQEQVRRALVAYITKRDVKSLPEYIRAEGHQLHAFQTSGK